MRTIVFLAFFAVTTVGQVPSSHPTTREIERAYHVTGSAGVPLTTRVLEIRRTREIRGWKLKFKRESEERYPGVRITHESAYASKNGVCARYRITNTMIIPPNVQVRPSLVVEEPTTCR